MEFRAPFESYAGRVREVVIGSGGKAVKVGGENSLPFHFFEGEIPNPVKFSLEILDMEPEGWPPYLVEPYRDVIGDPPRWAKKCVEYGADMVCITLLSTEPAEKDTSPEDAAKLVKEVLEAIDVPLIVYGSGNVEKDGEVLPKVCEVCSGKGLLVGPLQKENYEPIMNAALEHGHSVVAQAPLDINLQKEINVKIAKSFPPERIVIDPLAPALGYGMEYGFSMMERIKQIGVIHKDPMMQMPIIAYFGGECWKQKDAKEGEEQGILWEALTGLTFALAGANILVMRHPKTLSLLREIVEVKA